MARYIVGRLVSLLFVLIAVSVITFLLMHAVPGGPFDVTERRLPEATRAAQLRKYGLDGPLWEQYLRYMWHAVRGDFGVPFQSPTETVTGLIARAWPVTIKIGVPTILLAFSLGTLLGTVAAIRQNTWLDYAITFGASLGLVVPNFVIAIWLVLLFSVRFDWLPPGGWGEPKHYVLPVLAYALAPTALVARYTRASLSDALRADYVRTARAKGLRESQVLTAHVARNSLIPFVTILLPEIPNILTGSIFIEATFRIPGLGRFFVTSTASRDYPMILALVLLVAALWGITFLLTDLLYTVLDPRIRLTGGRGVGAMAVPTTAQRVSVLAARRSAAKPRSNAYYAARRFLRHRLAVVGLIISVLLLLTAVFAPLLAPTPYDYADLMAANQFPSWKYPLGTDTIGHDYLSRLIYGVRTSLIVAFAAVVIACLIGLPLGLLAGLRGGTADFVVMRIVEVMTAFPGILFAIFLISVVGSGLFNVILVIGLTSWVTLCRLMRAQLLTLREQEYVMAARSIGVGETAIAVRHLLPNALAPLIVAVTLAIPTAIFTEAGLSFLGIGINEPTPSLGRMVADSATYIRVYWHLGLFPTLAIALAMLGFTFVGDGLRDALDPRQT